MYKLYLVVNSPVDAVTVDLGEDEHCVVAIKDLALTDGFDGRWSTFEHACK